MIKGSTYRAPSTQPRAKQSNTRAKKGYPIVIFPLARTRTPYDDAIFTDGTPS